MLLCVAQKGKSRGIDMPYIKQEDRERYREALAQMIGVLESIPEVDRDGHINYVITVILKRLYKPPKYRRYNKAIGVLERIKQEFYRRVVAPYENSKIFQNGDVE